MPSTPSPSLVPDTPPTPGAPMIVLRRTVSGGCDDEGIRMPMVVIYRDGSTLTTDDAAALCLRLPSVRAGRVDAGPIASELDAYFASAAASQDMTHLDGPVGVSDGTTTELAYTDGNGHRHRAAAYQVDLDAKLSAVRNEARRTFGALVTSLTVAARSAKPWTPPTLRVVKAPDWATSDTERPVAWPVAPSAGLRAVINGTASCTTVAGAEARTLRKVQADRPAMTSWRVDGRIELLAIGLVLPGLQACSDG